MDRVGGFGQIPMFAYILSRWVQQDAYVIERISEKQISWKKWYMFPNFYSHNFCKETIDIWSKFDIFDLTPS